MALEAAYAFNDVGSSTVLDLSGNGRNIDLTGTNGVQSAGGKHGGGLGKTGSNTVQLPSSVVAAFKTDDWSVMFDARGILQTWWFRCWDGVNSGVRGILDLDGTAMRGQLRTAPGDVLQTRPTAAVPDATLWTANYCLTYERSTGLLTFYRNGTQASQVDLADGTQSSTNFTIIDVAEFSAAGPSIDNLRIFSHRLSPSEVDDLDGTPVELSAGSAELAGTLARMTAALDATVTAQAELVATMPRMQFVGDAIVTSEAELAGSLKRMTAQLEASELLPVTATLEATLLKMQAGVTSTVTAEMLQQRLLTKAFIDSSPIEITLTPRVEQRKPSGGIAMVSGPDRPKQTFRLIPMSHTERPVRSSSVATTADDGVQRRYDYTLLGEWNSQISENDQWLTDDGQLLVVDAVVSYNGYERKGLITSYGRSPEHVE